MRIHVVAQVKLDFARHHNQRLPREKEKYAPDQCQGDREHAEHDQTRRYQSCNRRLGMKTLVQGIDLDQVTHQIDRTPHHLRRIDPKHIGNENTQDARKQQLFVAPEVGIEAFEGFHEVFKIDIQPDSDAEPKS